MTLYTIELSYQAIHMASTNLDKGILPLEEYDPFFSPIWVADPPPSNEFLDIIFL